MFCAQLVLVCSASPSSEDSARERLLLGFEADQIAQMIERLAEEKIEAKRTTAKMSEGVEQVTVVQKPRIGSYPPGVHDPPPYVNEPGSPR